MAMTRRSLCPHSVQDCAASPAGNTALRSDRIGISCESRMKARREHRVRLSPWALAILQEIQAARHSGADGAFVFSGRKLSSPLSNMAFLMLSRRMGRADPTAHDFRATFKTWGSERKSFQNEIIEASLAHVIGGKVK